MKVEITTTVQECQALIFLIDAAVKSLGIRGAGDAVGWVAKIEAAIKEAGASSEDPVMEPVVKRKAKADD